MGNGWTKASQMGFYNSKAWRNVRNTYIDLHPLCEQCLKKGKLTGGTLVDHIDPIVVDASGNIDPAIALNADNLQTLCNECHSIKTRKDHSKYNPANMKRGKKIMQQMESEPPQCKHENTEHVFKPDQHPYGHDVEFDLCLNCGEKLNFQVR